MNNNLKAAFICTGVIIVGVLSWVWVALVAPTERYVSVVEQVQDKAVMIEVPTVYEQVSFIIEKKKLRIDVSTVPTTFLGSGVIVKANGTVLSCAHVFETQITGPIVGALSDGTTHQMTLIYKSTDSDLALLKMEGTYPHAVLSKRKLRLGQEVLAVGNPHGQQFSTSHGIISHLGRRIKDPYAFTQTDAAINGGNSGGPLFNLEGKLIGIVARKWGGADGMGLAIEPKTIKEFLEIFGL